MRKGSVAPLMPSEEGGLTSGPPSDPLEGLRVRLDSIETMVKALFEALLGRGVPPRVQGESALLPFNPREYDKAMKEARGGNYRAIRAYLKKYEGKRG